ncbi:hypothetical protein AVEN_4665-1 [Araneus ventricosus]|uniref:Uncharacterized protein n=1 Tax=Araneus ventricosus TaxID=182803 RepID=A0A4Y2I1C4_ARAVE|nr:hypothetical protein AVEN_4665-1 [Araneus ventricosus]
MPDRIGGKGLLIEKVAVGFMSCSSIVSNENDFQRSTAEGLAGYLCLPEEEGKRTMSPQIPIAVLEDVLLPFERPSRMSEALGNILLKSLNKILLALYSKHDDTWKIIILMLCN